MADPFDIDTRPGLPAALRTLVAEFPRPGWEAHPNFGGLVRFWLDRHLTFRRLTALLDTDTRALIDRSLDPRQFAARLSRFGGMLVGDLHGHHQIEDFQYFPLLARLEPGIARGFEMLETDHHALDARLAAFTEAANAVLRPAVDGAGYAALREGGAAFAGELGALNRLLDRHLEDEEDLVVPVILRHGEGRLG